MCSTVPMTATRFFCAHTALGSWFNATTTWHTAHGLRRTVLRPLYACILTPLLDPTHFTLHTTPCLPTFHAGFNAAHCTTPNFLHARAVTTIDTTKGLNSTTCSQQRGTRVVLLPFLPLRAPAELPPPTAPPSGAGATTTHRAHTRRLIWTDIV